jgi:hypothetical protein
MARVFLYVCEGETDVLFYKKVINQILVIHPQPVFDQIADPINACGIGNFQKTVKSKVKTFYLDNEDDYPDCSFTIALCRDHDVFSQQNPPVDWKRLLTDLKAMKRVEKVVTIDAYESIEDLFLLDSRGIARFLGREPIYTFQGKNGADKMENYFVSVNRHYLKGSYSSDFIDCLNIPMIMSKSCETISQICALFNILKPCEICLEMAHDNENNNSK